MFRVLLLASVAVMSQSQPVVLSRGFPVFPSASVYVQPAPVRYVAPPIIVKEAPKPYSFGYEAPATGGSSSRHESSDGNGRVVGSYTVADADGRLRVVDYYADETGFHANVKTNEPGTANQDSADVTVQSYAPPAVAPVVAPPKVIVTPARYVPPARVVARAPIYSIAPPVRRIVAPIPASYAIHPAYNSLSHSPVPYGSYAPYYRSYAPNIAYYK